MNIDKTQETTLWDNYIKDRCNNNRNALIMLYSPFVKIVIGKLVNRYNKYLDYDDLMSYGMIGLIDAIEKFDITKGVKFETYAAIRIRGDIIDQLRRQDWLPSSLRQRIKKVESAYCELEDKFGTNVTDADVAKYLNIKIDELNELLEVSHAANIVSFDHIISSSFCYSALNSKYEPEYELEEKILKKSLVAEVEKLTDKEKLVISLYYYDELTLKEIGVVLGVSESRVSQIHSKILIKLKNRLNIVVSNK